MEQAKPTYKLAPHTGTQASQFGGNLGHWTYSNGTDAYNARFSSRSVQQVGEWGTVKANNKPSTLERAAFFLCGVYALVIVFEVLIHVFS